MYSVTLFACPSVCLCHFVITETACVALSGVSPAGGQNQRFGLLADVYIHFIVTVDVL